MNTKAIYFTLSLMALTLVSGQATAQVTSEVITVEDQRIDSVHIRGEHRMDSIQTLHKAEKFQTQAMKDETRMTDVKRERKLSKAKAKEAQRVGREANDAARESNNAFRAEKQAQKARKNADKQAERAAESRDKSDRN